MPDTQDIDALHQIQIKVMMPCDSAQAVAGKLYILGGGFDQLNVPTLPFDVRFDLAILLEVPWTSTNDPYHLVIEMADADGVAESYRAEAKMETGRPPGVSLGTSFAIPLTLPVAATLEKPGRHILRGLINGKERQRVGIDVIAPQEA